MKQTRKHSVRRTIALLLTIFSLLGGIIPAVSAEETGSAAQTQSKTAELVNLTGSIVGNFTMSEYCYMADTEVNGHDYLFIPHHKSLFVYDLDEWKKVDEEYLGLSTAYGAFVDSSGIVWVYGVKQSLYRYDPVSGTGGWVSSYGFEGATHVYDVTEANGKLYLATYNNAKLIEYDPATDTYTDLGTLVASAKRIGTLKHKDGFIYATVHSSAAGTAPNELVKYDIANKKIVDSLDINNKDTYTGSPWCTGITIVGDTLMIASVYPKGPCAVDISGDKMVVKDVGFEKGAYGTFSEVIVEKDSDGNVINEKVYFFAMMVRRNVAGQGWTPFNYLCEFNSKTGVITPVDTFPHATADDYVNNYIHTRGGGIVTVDADIEGWTGPSVLTVHAKGSITLFNLASGKTLTDTELTNGDGSAKQPRVIVSGPDGSNKLYIGCYSTNLVSVYDITTGQLERYPTYSDQLDYVYWYEGKCYVANYQRAAVSEINFETGEVNTLFAINLDPYGADLIQERIHNVVAGDNKVFATTVPIKGFLGGYVAWYDYDEATTYLAVEADKVLYLKDTDKTTWYDAKTNEKIVFPESTETKNHFSGLIADQAVKSIAYQNGYLYGTTYVGGGSGSTPAEDASAVLFAYDVENKKLAATCDLRNEIEGLPETLQHIGGIAADPDVPGKFWGIIAGTLFSFTYDETAGTFAVTEELSFGKNNNSDYFNFWTSFPIIFDDGYIYVNLREDVVSEGDDTTNLRMICKDDPSYNFCLVDTKHGGYALGDDGNIYTTSLDNYGLAMFPTANRIAEIKANKAALDAAEEKINAIGEVTLESEEAIKAARAAYDALPEEVKAMVDNTTVLEAAEAKLAELKAAAEKAAADKAAADATAAKINAIGEVTLESEEAIKAARETYDALTEEQKALVSNLDVLTAAEAKLAELKDAADKAAADKAAADAAAAKINAIGEVTLESEEAIKAAREAYDALTEEQKALVSNLDALTAAESKLAELKAAAEKAAADKAAADAVAAKIEAIGTVTLESEETIKAAREAYDALTEEQKALVSNLDVLTAAETKLAELQAAAEDAERIEAARDVVGKALAAMTVTNDTSKEAIQKTIDEALAKAEITDATASVTNVAITAATTEKAGSTKITVVITSGKGSESTVNTKTIAKLIPPADPENPQTGDETNLLLLVLLMVISIMGIAVSVIFFRKLSYKGKYLK